MVTTELCKYTKSSKSTKVSDFYSLHKGRLVQHVLKVSSVAGAFLHISSFVSYPNAILQMMKTE